MDFGAGSVQLWIHSAEPPGNIVTRKKQQQQAEHLVESAPLRGLDKGS